MTHYFMRTPRRYRWAQAGGHRMPIDVQSEEEAYLITAAVPGLTAEDLEIEVLDDVVTMRGELQDEEPTRLLSNIERAGGYFRRVRLPEDVDSEAIEAKVENGLLTVRIPKAEESRPKRIEVKSC